MRVNHCVAAAVLAASILSGCNTISESDYKAGKNIVAESPTAKRLIVKDCIEKQRRQAGAKQREIAAFLKIPESRYAETICKRMVNAIANGRLTYADVANSNSMNEDKILRVMQGK
jgi:hypothetical protein